MDGGDLRWGRIETVRGRWAVEFRADILNDSHIFCSIQRWIGEISGKGLDVLIIISAHRNISCQGL